jgi:lipopolysaccharide export system protein LptA
MSLTWRICASCLAGLLMVVFTVFPGTAHAATADLFNGFQAKSKDPVEVNADVLDISEKGNQRISVFSGNVVVRRGDTVLKAAKITLYSDLKASTSEGFTRIEATGGVFVSSKDQTVTGQTATVDMTTHVITVSGGVVLSQGGNVLTGSQLVVNLTTGQARVEQEAGKQIRGVFTPQKAPGGQAAGQ